MPLPEVKCGAEACGSEERIPEVTIVGTELVMELGGASMPDGCSGGRGGGGPRKAEKFYVKQWLVYAKHFNGEKKIQMCSILKTNVVIFWPVSVGLFVSLTISRVKQKLTILMELGGGRRSIGQEEPIKFRRIHILLYFLGNITWTKSAVLHVLIDR